MKRITNFQLRIVLVIVAAMFFAGSVTRAAQNQHYVGDVTATLVGTNAQVCWKEAGLGDNQLINYEARGIGTATFHCVNNGGQCPDAANKVTVTGPVIARGTFASDKNGHVTACLTLEAPEPPDPAEFSCPSGQTLTLTDFSISNITITDTTNDVTKTATPSAFSATLFVCPGR
jgi:hypothetical protein